jgi:hypothetical protein
MPPAGAEGVGSAGAGGVGSAWAASRFDFRQGRHGTAHCYDRWLVVSRYAVGRLRPGQRVRQVGHDHCAQGPSEPNLPGSRQPIPTARPWATTSSRSRRLGWRLDSGGRRTGPGLDRPGRGEPWRPARLARMWRSWAVLPAVRTSSAASNQPRATTARTGVVGSLRSITSRRRAASAPTSAGPRSSSPSSPTARSVGSQLVSLMSWPGWDDLAAPKLGEGGPQLGRSGRVELVQGRARQPRWVQRGNACGCWRNWPGGPTRSSARRAGDGLACRGLLVTIGRRCARLGERPDVGGGDCLSGQAGVKGVGRRQQPGAVSLPQRPGHQLLGGGAGRQGPGGLGDGFVLGLAGVVVVEEVGHAAKQLGNWRDVVGHGACKGSDSRLSRKASGGLMMPPRTLSRVLTRNW